MVQLPNRFNDGQHVLVGHFICSETGFVLFVNTFFDVLFLLCLTLYLYRYKKIAFDLGKNTTNMLGCSIDVRFRLILKANAFEFIAKKSVVQCTTHIHNRWRSVKTPYFTRHMWCGFVAVYANRLRQKVFLVFLVSDKRIFTK